MISQPITRQPPPPCFQQEAAELLQQIGAELQQLHQNFNLQKSHRLMHLAHTLKGAAATVGLDGIKTTTQALENAFKALCTPDARLTAPVYELLLEGYRCLALLLSVPLANNQINESKVLDRMTVIVAKLQQILGDRFGQTSYLPTSAQLGVDVTQSIFENGVTEYLDELTNALANPDPDFLGELLQVQADVFIGLGESLNLPGFGKIAQATLTALSQHPEQVIPIAQLALHDYRAGQAYVLNGDRNQGGTPSPALIQLGTCQQTQPNWVKTLWQRLNQPISPLNLIPQVKPSQPGPATTNQKQPLSQLFQQCHKELNQLTQQQGKPVVVKLKGEDVRLDPAIVNQLQAPLLHLTRNAFNHDIEIPVVRRRQGKSAVGKIQLAAKQAEQYVVICVWDDGCGPNPETIRQQVHPHIEALKGIITAAYHPGKGTCFTLTIPASSDWKCVTQAPYACSRQPMSQENANFSS